MKRRQSLRTTENAAQERSGTVLHSNERTATGREGSIDTTDIENIPMTREVKAQVELATEFARRLGVDVRLVYEDGSINGSYRNGVITLNVKKAMTRGSSRAFLLKVMSHEMTHFIRQFSPEMYADLRGFIAKELTRELGQDGFDGLVADKQAEYKGTRPREGDR